MTSRTPNQWNDGKTKIDMTSGNMTLEDIRPPKQSQWWGGKRGWNMIHKNINQMYHEMYVKKKHLRGYILVIVLGYKQIQSRIYKYPMLVASKKARNHSVNIPRDLHFTYPGGTSSNSSSTAAWKSSLTRENNGKHIHSYRLSIWTYWREMSTKHLYVIQAWDREFTPAQKTFATKIVPKGFN